MSFSTLEILNTLPVTSLPHVLFKYLYPETGSNIKLTLPCASALFVIKSVPSIVPCPLLFTVTLNESTNIHGSLYFPVPFTLVSCFTISVTFVLASPVAFLTISSPIMYASFAQNFVPSNIYEDTVINLLSLSFLTIVNSTSSFDIKSPLLVLIYLSGFRKLLIYFFDIPDAEVKLLALTNIGINNKIKTKVTIFFIYNTSIIDYTKKILFFKVFLNIYFFDFIF